MKTYFAKVYKPNDDYITTWADIKFDNFTQTLNGGLGQLTIELAREFDDFGEGDDVKLNNEVQLWVHDSDTGPEGLKIYSGYISGYTPWIRGKQQGVRVNCLGYWTKLKKSWFRGASSFNVSYSSQDIATIVKGIVNNYSGGTGLPTGSGLPGKISYSGTSIPATTGTSVSYTFSLFTHADAIERMRAYAPANWWYYLGANNLLQFKSKEPNAQHTFVFGKDFHEIEVFKNIEGVVNRILFWNGQMDTDEDYIQTEYNDLDSIQDYNQTWERKTDGRVSIQGTADALSNAILDENADAEVQITVEIADNNGDSGGYDIESIQVGDTCNFRGFNDITSSTFDDKMIIKRLTYTPDSVELEIGRVSTTTGLSVNRIDTELEDAINTDAP